MDGARNLAKFIREKLQLEADFFAYLLPIDAPISPEPILEDAEKEEGEEGQGGGEEGDGLEVAAGGEQNEVTSGSGPDLGPSFPPRVVSPILAILPEAPCSSSVPSDQGAVATDQSREMAIEVYHGGKLSSIELLRTRAPPTSACVLKIQIQSLTAERDALLM
ncbi:hypothetical protein NE237_007649 [Protea cynaroides]|uniref:Uncharacterized protein n=1 Tax=Protea cynaroides TaxID=273540 RepID=A0A9Q0QWN2_9MAGN|nr:hypothetical protein NE237_007649 [Protea cynaroides]